MSDENLKPEAKEPISSGPLNHIKVTDFSSFAAGPFCAKLLADFGAEVIKIEAPKTGDKARGLGAGPGNADDPEARERSPLFLYVNTNKRGITLDPGSEKGREVFRKLIADADVLIEDRTPGEMEKWGLGYEQLRQINPGPTDFRSSRSLGVIYVSFVNVRRGQSIASSLSKSLVQ